MSSRPNQNRQLGTYKVWVDETTGYFWCSVHVHFGRYTKMIRGPLGKTIVVAKSLFDGILKEDLKGALAHRH